jgi:hypothetical protein
MLVNGGLPHKLFARFACALHKKKPSVEAFFGQLNFSMQARISELLGFH